MPRQIETENITGVITQWISNESPKPSKFLLDVGDTEVELTIWPDRASQVAMRDSLELIDPDDLVNQQVVATVEMPHSEYQGTVQYRVIKIKPGNAAKEAPAQVKKKQVAPVPNATQPGQAEPASYAPVSRQEIGMATGNAKNGGYTVVAAYYEKHGELPGDEFLIACAERINFFADALMFPPAPEEESTPPTSEDDDLGLINLDEDSE